MNESRNRILRGHLKRLTAHLILLVLAFVYITPVLFMFVGSLKPDERVLPEADSWKAVIPDPETVSLQNYRDVLSSVPFTGYLLNSVLISGGIVLGGLIVNSLAGYALARLKWTGRKLAFGAVLALMILPLETIAVPLFYEVTVMSWRNTYTVQIVPFVANAFSIYLFYAFFIGLPSEFEESARVDGAGPWRIFLQIIVPNSKPVYAAVTIVTFLMYWGLYLWPLMVTTGEEVRPLPLAIATFRAQPPLQWGDIMAFAVMMVLPVLLIFLFFQRWFIRGVATSGIKG
jgi:multiple sugar transport system permease protein